MEIKAGSVVDEAYGIVIILTNEIGKQYDEYAKNAKYKAEVKIVINGKSKEFTFKEFAKRLGLKWS